MPINNSDVLNHLEMTFMRDSPESRRPGLQHFARSLAVRVAGALALLMPAGVGAQPLEAPTASELRTASPAPTATDEPSPRGAAHPPLVVVDVPERWIAALAERLFAERSQVDIAVLGVRMRGSARTKGGYTIRCVDGDGGICFAIDAEGTSVSTTRGREGPAFIRAIATTDFTARKLIELDGQSLVAHAASAEATLRRCDMHVDTRFRLGRQLVGCIARRVARANHREIEWKAEHRTEQRVTAVVDRAVEQFRNDANQHLQQMQAQFPWIGWGDDTTPVHLQTGDRVLRLTWRDGGGEMADPFYLAVGEPSPGLRLWVDRRALRVESRRLRQHLRRTWQTIALIAPLLPGESSDAPWSVELAVSSWALEVMVPSAGVIVRVPGPRDPMTAILTAAAQSIARGDQRSRPAASDGQDDAATTP